MRTSAIARWVVKYTNLERKKRGIKPLRTHKALTKAAIKYSKILRKHRGLSHYLDGTPQSRATRAGFPNSYVGENCALVYVKRKESPKAVAKELMRLWMKSEGHRWNILHASYNRIGVGVALRWNSKLRMYEVYAVQMFGYLPPKQSKIVTISNACSFIVSTVRTWIFITILVGIVCLIICGISNLFSFSS